ncbi:hypothetical protein [Congregicoccus parvus]|uniref:hypothetical protein n=1 Tax=Congregicoccus parvus TaxID=3081749 RepID=UPI003FA5D683
MLIRVLGPKLVEYGLAREDVIADPVLELYNADGDLIGYNDNWADSRLMVHTPTGVRDLEREQTIVVGSVFDRVMEKACDLAGCDRFTWVTGTRSGQSKDAALLIKRLPVGVYTVKAVAKNPTQSKGELLIEVFTMDPRWDPLPEAYDKPLETWNTRLPGP